MQLRSGKTIRYSNTIAASENITMLMETQASGNNKRTTIANHPMSLRSSSRPVETYPKPMMHFADMVAAQTCEKKKSDLLFRHWLITRLKTLTVSIAQVYCTNYKTTTLERVRLISEMVSVMYDHIDYITSSLGLGNFPQIMCSKLEQLSSEITTLLNGGSINGDPVYKFTQEERVFIGNVRKDMINLMVITKNRIY
jgi:hypothetical protein